MVATRPRRDDWLLVVGFGVALGAMVTIEVLSPLMLSVLPASPGPRRRGPTDQTRAVAGTARRLMGRRS